MTWKIYRPWDGDCLPDHTTPLLWGYEELHGAKFIADVGDGDDQFIAFELLDGRTAKLLSFDLQHEDDGKDILVWEEVVKA
jgi:hypothetical protein